MSRHPIRVWGIAVALAVALAVPMAASNGQDQPEAERSGWPDRELRVGAGYSMWSETLLGRPFGFAASFAELLGGRVSLRLGYESYRDDFRSVGSTCAGFVPPGMDCTDETRDEQSEVQAVTLSLPTVTGATSTTRLSIVPGIRLAWLRSDQRGLRTGRHREANKWTYGADVGAEVASELAVRRPLRLHAALNLGIVSGRDQGIVDGYAPFDQPMAFATVQVGASFMW